MSLRSRPLRLARLLGIASLLITVNSCRHGQKPEPPVARPTAAPAGLHRTSRHGIELTVELPASTRWSAHTIIRVSNNSTTPIHLPRHPTSLIHDYQLKLHDHSGADVATRMMLKLPQSTQPTSRLTLQPNQAHEEGLQLGMLFALRPGERYILSVAAAVHIADRREPTVLKIDDIPFSVTVD